MKTLSLFEYNELNENRFYNKVALYIIIVLIIIFISIIVLLKIKKNVFKLLKKKTIIVISHRFDNNDLFDKKIEILKGNLEYENA